MVEFLSIEMFQYCKKVEMICMSYTGGCIIGCIVA